MCSHGTQVTGRCGQRVHLADCITPCFVYVWTRRTFKYVTICDHNSSFSLICTTIYSQFINRNCYRHANDRLHKKQTKCSNYLLSFASYCSASPGKCDIFYVLTRTHGCNLAVAIFLVHRYGSAWTLWGPAWMHEPLKQAWVSVILVEEHAQCESSVQV
jgi:hypothetical protein